MTKKCVSITLSPEIHKMAKRQGLNISQASERGIYRELGISNDLNTLTSRERELIEELELIRKKITDLRENEQELNLLKNKENAKVWKAIKNIKHRLDKTGEIPGSMWTLQAGLAGISVEELKEEFRRIN